MDFRYLNSFFNYELCLDEDPQRLVDKIILLASEYLPKDQIPKIQHVYEYTRKAHEWQKRLSGEYYISHPVQTALILMQIKPDIASIQSAFLHDVIEDTSLEYDDIVKEFWEEVADICVWLEKVSKLKYKWEDRHLETIKKTFLAMAKDLRVILVKLADRIHNIQTLSFHPNPVKQEKIALETMKIYVPIAKRLGLYHFQVILENGCFKILHPLEFWKILWYLDDYFKNDQKYVDKWVKKLEKILYKEWITRFKIKWRFKSPFRIYEKMENKYENRDFSKVMDIVAFRIVTKNIEDCYMSLWVIHKYYTPIISKIKDYIAIPKFNGYKSIHTTVLWFFNTPVELQIRTYEMDDIAEFWVAAHFAYSENNKPIAISTKQWEWIKRLQQVVEAYTSSEKKDDFKNKLNMEFLSNETFLYTPKWDVVWVPKWSSVLDFAFTIHTEVWLKFKNAIVNGNIVWINHIPRSWDIIEIKTYKNKYTATKYWVDYLNIPSTKAKLNKYIRSLKRDSLIEEWKYIINQKLGELNLPLLGTKWDRISTWLSESEYYKTMLSVLDKTTTASHVVKQFYEKEYAELLSDKKRETKATISQEIISNISNDIIIDGNKFIKYVFCPECNVKEWDKIIAKTTKEWIKIHRVWCVAMRSVNFEKLLEAHWEWRQKNLYVLILKCKVNKNLSMSKLLWDIYKSGIDIKQLSFNNENSTTLLDIESEFIYPSKVQEVINILKKYKNSVTIIKRKII